jgi:hypothetical protein
MLCVLCLLEGGFTGLTSSCISIDRPRVFIFFALFSDVEKSVRVNAPIVQIG